MPPITNLFLNVYRGSGGPSPSQTARSKSGLKISSSPTALLATGRGKEINAKTLADLRDKISALPAKITQLSARPAPSEEPQVDDAGNSPANAPERNDEAAIAAVRLVSRNMRVLADDGKNAYEVTYRELRQCEDKLGAAQDQLKTQVGVYNQALDGLRDALASCALSEQQFNSLQRFDPEHMPADGAMDQIVQSTRDDLSAIRIKIEKYASGYNNVQQKRALTSAIDGLLKHPFFDALASVKSCDQKIKELRTTLAASKSSPDTYTAIDAVDDALRGALEFRTVGDWRSVIDKLIETGMLDAKEKSALRILKAQLSRLGGADKPLSKEFSEHLNAALWVTAVPPAESQDKVHAKYREALRRVAKLTQDHRKAELELGNQARTVELKEDLDLALKEVAYWERLQERNELDEFKEQYNGALERRKELMSRKRDVELRLLAEPQSAQLDQDLKLVELEIHYYERLLKARGEASVGPYQMDVIAADWVKGQVAIPLLENELKMAQKRVAGAKKELEAVHTRKKKAEQDKKYAVKRERELTAELNKLPKKHLLQQQDLAVSNPIFDRGAAGDFDHVHDEVAPDGVSHPMRVNDTQANSKLSETLQALEVAAQEKNESEDRIVQEALNVNGGKSSVEKAEFDLKHLENSRNVRDILEGKAGKFVGELELLYITDKLATLREAQVSEATTETINVLTRAAVEIFSEYLAAKQSSIGRAQEVDPIEEYLVLFNLREELKRISEYSEENEALAGACERIGRGGQDGGDAGTGLLADVETEMSALAPDTLRQWFMSGGKIPGSVSSYAEENSESEAELKSDVALYAEILGLARRSDEFSEIELAVGEKLLNVLVLRRAGLSHVDVPKLSELGKSIAAKTSFAVAEITKSKLNDTELAPTNSELVIKGEGAQTPIWSSGITKYKLDGVELALTNLGLVEEVNKAERELSEVLGGVNEGIEDVSYFRWIIDPDGVSVFGRYELENKIRSADEAEVERRDGIRRQFNVLSPEIQSKLKASLAREHQALEAAGGDIGTQVSAIKESNRIHIIQDIKTLRDDLVAYLQDVKRKPEKVNFERAGLALSRMTDLIALDARLREVVTNRDELGGPEPIELAQLYVNVLDVLAPKFFVIEATRAELEKITASTAELKKIEATKTKLEEIKGVFVGLRDQLRVVGSMGIGSSNERVLNFAVNELGISIDERLSTLENFPMAPPEPKITLPEVPKRPAAPRLALRVARLWSSVSSFLPIWMLPSWMLPSRSSVKAGRVDNAFATGAGVTSSKADETSSKEDNGVVPNLGVLPKAVDEGGMRPNTKIEVSNLFEPEREVAPVELN